MVAKDERVSEVDSDSDSGRSGVSDNSSTDSECTFMAQYTSHEPGPQNGVLGRALGATYLMGQGMLSQELTSLKTQRAR